VNLKTLWPFKRRQSSAAEPIPRDDRRTLTDMQAANVALAEGRYAEAVELYERHARTHEKDAPRCYTKMAEASLRTNTITNPQEQEGVTFFFAPDDMGAERALRRALAIDPNYFPALAALGEVLPRQDEERRRVLEKAASLRSDLRVLLRLADLYEEANEPELAYRTYRKAQEHAPLDGTAYEGLERVCRLLGNGDEAALWAERRREAYAKKPRVDGKGRG
jgi:tetratricopeptide (TPR) repeat protein